MYIYIYIYIFVQIKVGISLSLEDVEHYEPTQICEGNILTSNQDFSQTTVKKINFKPQSRDTIPWQDTVQATVRTAAGDQVWEYVLCRQYIGL